MRESLCFSSLHFFLVRISLPHPPDLFVILSSLWINYVYFLEFVEVYEHILKYLNLTILGSRVNLTFAQEIEMLDVKKYVGIVWVILPLISLLLELPDATEVLQPA